MARHGLISRRAFLQAGVVSLDVVTVAGVQRRIGRHRPDQRAGGAFADNGVDVKISVIRSDASTPALVTSAGPTLVADLKRKLVGTDRPGTPGDYCTRVAPSRMGPQLSDVKLLPIGATDVRFHAAAFPCSPPFTTACCRCKTSRTWRARARTTRASSRTRTTSSPHKSASTRSWCRGPTACKACWSSCPTPPSLPRTMPHLSSSSTPARVSGGG